MSWELSGGLGELCGRKGLHIFSTPRYLSVGAGQRFRLLTELFERLLELVKIREVHVIGAAAPRLFAQSESTTAG